MLIRTSSVEAVRSLVATGAGVTVLPDMLYRPWSLEGDRIEARPLAHPMAVLDVGLAWRKGAAQPESLSNFLNAVRPTLDGHGLAAAKACGTCACASTTLASISCVYARISCSFATAMARRSSALACAMRLSASA